MGELVVFLRLASFVANYFLREDYTKVGWALDRAVMGATVEPLLKDTP
jgi:hypothetical protein